MARHKRRAEWRTNANETQVTVGFNMGVATVGTIGGAGWTALRWLALRLGLRLDPPPELAAPAGVDCTRCGTLVLAGERACSDCGRALAPSPASTDAQIAAFAAEAERRRRGDILRAILAGLVVGIGILLVAQTMERGLVQTLGIQLWWLAGIFWGVVVFAARQWLDQ